MKRIKELVMEEGATDCFVFDWWAKMHLGAEESEKAFP